MDSTHSEGPRKGKKPAEAAEPSLLEGEATRPIAGDCCESASADGAEDRALSVTRPVTRPVSFSEAGVWKLLSVSVDSLYLGLKVFWGPLWETQVEEFERLKTEAAGTKGKPIWDARCLMLAGGRAPMYRWALQYPGFKMYLGKSQRPQTEAPNVWVEIGSETLWRNGIEEAVRLVIEEVQRLAGRVEQVIVSRADPTADFHLPNGLSLDFIRARRVPRQYDHRHFMAGDRLETFYQGGPESVIQCRIYDKGREIAEGGTKFWFLDLWKIESLADVWRVEFQLRREALKALEIHTVEDLLAKLNQLWTYLTDKWFILREADNKNSSRRTVTPWWVAVQEAFGACDGMPLRTKPDDRPAETGWYTSHVAGLVAGYASRKGISDPMMAIKMLAEEAAKKIIPREFAEAYARKRITLGRTVESVWTPKADAA